MGAIDDYLTDLDPRDSATIRAVYEVALRVVPHAEQGTSYGMPALRASGKPLLAVIAHPAHLSLHPFSAEVVAEVAPALTGFSLSKGTIRFTSETPVPEPVIERIVTARLKEITGT